MTDDDEGLARAAQQLELFVRVLEHHLASTPDPTERMRMEVELAEFRHALAGVRKGDGALAAVILADVFASTSAVL